MGWCEPATMQTFIKYLTVTIKKLHHFHIKHLYIDIYEMWMSKLVFWGEGTLASYVKFSMRREGTIACELSLVWPVFYKKTSD